MRADSRVQETWLRLLGPADSSQSVRVEQIQEGYYAVVREATGPSPAACGDADFGAVKAFIPNLARTRAVYLNQESAYGLSNTESLCGWAGPLAEQVERGTRHAFAVVDPEIFARHVCAAFQASGWKVEHLQQDLRVSGGRFTENANLLRAIVQMVLSRASFADAAGALRADLNERFSVDAKLFERFAARFAKYRPTVFDHYFAAYPQCSCLAAGWDCWQVSNRDTHDAAEVFEQAMKEFESFLTMAPEDWLLAFATDCCEQSTTEN